MIYKITWDLDKKLPGGFKYSYFRDIKFFKENQEIEFFPGLNIITGNNGSGKSTVVNILKYFFLEEHENQPCINTDEFDQHRYYYHFPLEALQVKANFKIPTVSMTDPRIKEAGRMTRTSFMRKVNHGSSGELTFTEYNLAVSSLYEHNKDYQDPRKIIKKKLHDPDEIITWYDKNQVDDKIPCLIMDEPDNSVSLRNILVLRRELSEMVENCSSGMQIIMVLHNPILLKHFVEDPRVNYIEMTPGYKNLIKSI